MPRKPETTNRIKSFENEAKSFVATNLYNLRTVLGRLIGVSSQQAMADYLGDLHRGTYCQWENSADSAMPGYGEIANLQYLLSQRAETKALSQFPIGAFYTQVINFAELGEQVDNSDCTPFLGPYIAYYYDFSEVRINQLETSRLRMRYLVAYLYESFSLTGDRELHSYVIPFKLRDRAEHALSAIDGKAASCSKMELPGVLEQLFKTELCLTDNDIYCGAALLSKNSPCLQINATNRSQSDSVSMLFLRPGNIPDPDIYIGGLGCMISFCRGINNHPIAQKLIISRSPLQDEETRIGKHLRVQSSDLPIDGRVMQIVESNEKLQDADAFGISPEERYLLLTYRLKNLVDTYNTQLNLTGFHISREEDNAVFHLIKHFSVKK